MVRAFVAVKIAPSEILLSLLSGLSGTGEKIKVVDGKNLHLTLKFLGETDEGTMRALADRLKDDIDMPSFSIDVVGTGHFGRKGSPSVLWAGVGESRELCELAGIVETAAVSLGFPKERRSFSPHLTLARVRHGRALRSLEVLEKYKGEALAREDVDSVRIVRSTLTPKGPVYDDLHVVELRR